MKALQTKAPVKADGQGTTGRPRSEKARLAIMQAAYELLYKAQPRDITTNMIAAEAGVSTATLYRWWPTKEAVLLDAYIGKVNQAFPKTEESALATLNKHALRVGHIFEGKNARVTLRLLMAIQEDETLRRSFWEQVCGPQMAFCENQISEAIKQGELPPETDKRMFLDGVFGTLVARLLMEHAPINNDVIQHAFDLAVAGARNVKKRPKSTKR